MQYRDLDIAYEVSSSHFEDEGGAGAPYTINSMIVMVHRVMDQMSWPDDKWKFAVLTKGSKKSGFYADKIHIDSAQKRAKCSLSLSLRHFGKFNFPISVSDHAVRKDLAGQVTSSNLVFDVGGDTIDVDMNDVSSVRACIAKVEEVITTYIINAGDRRDDE